MTLRIPISTLAFLLLYLILPKSTWAQSSYLNVYDLSNPSAMCPTYDNGGVVVTGQTGPNFFRIDQFGDTAWTREPLGVTTIKSAQSPDSTTIIGGYAVVSGTSDVVTMKIDHSGNAVWSKVHGGTLSNDVPSALCVSPNGNTAVVSRSAVTGNPADIGLMILSPAGDQIGSTLIGGTGEELIHAINPALDGGYLLCGKTFSFTIDTSTTPGFLIKTDSVGTVEWTRTVAHTNHIYGINTLPNGTIVAAGTNDGQSGTTHLLWLDSQGNLLSKRELVSASIQEVPNTLLVTDSTILLVVRHNHPTEGTSLAVVRMDHSGNVLDANSINNTWTIPVDMGLTNDGSLLLSGFGWAGNSALSIIKTDASYAVGCNQVSASITSSTTSDILGTGGSASAWQPLRDTTIALVSSPFTVTPVCSDCVLPQAHFDTSLTGNTLSLSSDALGAETIEWDFGNGATGTGGTASHFYLAGGTYDVCQIVTNVCGADTTCLQITISLPNDSVWPGDANYDGVANNLDLLPLGIAFGATGPVRTNASLMWAGQPAADWSGSLASGVNYKHSDCDGNGTIDAQDTLAIVANYGFIHNKGQVPPPFVQGAPLLYIDAEPDTLGLNDPFLAWIKLGTDMIPGSDIYGIAFTVEFDPALVDSSSIDFDTDSAWLGIEGTNMISLHKLFYSDGKMDVAMTRTDQTNQTGFGKLASLGGITADNISGKGQLMTATQVFTITNVTVISNTEAPVAVNTSSDSLVIVADAESTGESLASTDRLLAYPNPANTQIVIKTSNGVPLEQVTVFGPLGNVVANEMPVNSTLLLATSAWPRGAYLIRAQTSDRVMHQRIVVAH